MIFFSVCPPPAALCGCRIVVSCLFYDGKHCRFCERTCCSVRLCKNIELVGMMKKVFDRFRAFLVNDLDWNLFTNTRDL